MQMVPFSAGYHPTGPFHPYFGPGTPGGFVSLHSTEYAFQPHGVASTFIPPYNFQRQSPSSRQRMGAVGRVGNKQVIMHTKLQLCILSCVLHQKMYAHKFEILKLDRSQAQYYVWLRSEYAASIRYFCISYQYFCYIICYTCLSSGFCYSGGSTSGKLFKILDS